MVPSGRVLRDKRRSRSRGGAAGAPGGGWGAEGARSPRGARLRAGRGSEPTPETGPARRPRRAHEPLARVAPRGVTPLPEPWTAGPAARSRRRRAPREGTGCRLGSGGGFGERGGRTSLTMPCGGCRGGGGPAGAQLQERASRGATARRLHRCRSGASARGAKETHALALPHTRERRERRGGAAAPLPAAHAHTPGRPVGGGVPLCFFPLAALEAPRHQSSGHPLINKANQARRAKRGPGVGRECTLCSWPAEDQTFPAFARSSPGSRSQSTGSLALGLCATRAGAGVSASLCLSLVAALAAER